MDANIPGDYDNLLKKYNELKEASEYRQGIGSKFIDRMHYHFNTLLNSITGYIYVVNETADPAQKPSIDGALKTSKALLNKFSDMTDYLSILLGGYALNEAPFSIRQIMRQINQELDEAFLAKGLAFSCEIDESIPEYVELDGAAVRKVVTALVENAIQTTSSGTVKAAVSLVSEDRDTLVIKFSVKDEGKGADIEKVNSVLSDGLKDASFKRGGLDGLDLLIVKDFLEQLGSCLTVKNNEDVGAELSFSVNAITIARNAVADSEQGKPEAKALAGVKILFADDSVIMQQIVRQMLESEDAEVTVVSNGEEAVNLFSQRKFNLILMDVEMPILNGCDAVVRIKALEKGKESQTPVIGMTAHTKQEEYDKCVESGMSGVVIKPFKHKELMDAICKELFGEEYAEGQPASVTQGASSVYNFEKIKGIDYKEGLKRLGGNEKVYFELLQNFRDGYSDTALNISTLIIEGNDNEVKNLLHLIKGISGNLSFNEVYDYTNQLREALDRDNLADVTKYLKLLGEAIEEFKASLGAVEVELLYNTSEAMDMDLLLVKTRLKELHGYLEGDVDLGNALDACDDIYDYMKETDYRKDFGRIRDAINAFDLDLAKSLLEMFITKFS